MKEKIFYDIHCHAMNMSHPSIMAFARRCVRSLRELTVAEVMRSLGSLTKIRIIRELYDMALSAREAQNLLVVMENDAAGMFMLMEDCLAGKFEPSRVLLKDGKLSVAGHEYDKAILTPLIMDFGYRDHAAELNTYYKKPSSKPVSEQVVDVFNGIARYIKKTEYNFFEIYPFFGVTAKNYTMAKLRETLTRYFGGYSRSREALFANFGKFDGSPSNIGSDFFAGIKVYPPLGFDPWPEDDPEELEKVEFIYSLCCERDIPVTAHCNDEGFIIIGENRALEYTAPSRWEKALSKYPKLRLNLAHFGRQMNSPFGEWALKISSMMNKFDNLYVDFAFNAFDPEYYGFMKKFVSSAPDKLRKRMMKRIMFGSDFMMSLLKIESYSKYIMQFSETPHFTDEEKDRFCSANPAEFLFGR